MTIRCLVEINSCSVQCDRL